LLYGIEFLLFPFLDYVLVLVKWHIWHWPTCRPICLICLWLKRQPTDGPYSQF